MEANAYEQFRELEATHWWFLARHAIFETLLDRRVLPGLGPGAPRALDLGCGMGAHLGFLAERGAAVGVDLEPQCLRHCRGRGFRVAAADGTRLPFVDGAFDVVTAFDTIEHIPDDAGTVAEAFRVLRPGGRLFVSGPAWQFLYAHQDRVVHHQRRYTTGGFRRLCESKGFEVEYASYINFFLFPLILPAVLLLKAKEALRPPPPGDASTNASIKFNRFTNGLLFRIFAAERHVLARLRVPFGHSLVLIARKPA
jgi:SAM-dependent methyltransferase